MSEPASITALFHTSPESLKAYFRKKVSHALGDLVFEALEERPSGFHIIKYLKKEQALFVHLHFGFEPGLDYLLESPVFAALRALADFKDDDRPDRLAISLDANNFLASPIEAGFLIRPRQWQRDDNIPAAELKALHTLITKQFYAVAEKAGYYSTAYERLKIIDPAIKRRVERLREARDLENRIRRLPQATPLQPVRYGKGYFYNGKFVIRCYRQGIALLTGLDALAFRTTSYGGTDGRQVVVGNNVLHADVATFKRLTNDETVFFADKHKVYDDRLNVIADADGASFKLTHCAFAHDKNRWYFTDGTPLEDIGEFRAIDDALYYARSCILWGSKAVYLGSIKLPLDAPSARLVRSKSHRPSGGGWWSAETLWFEDKAGPLVAILYTDIAAPERANVRIIERTDKPEARLETLYAEALTRSNYPSSPFTDAARAVAQITQLDTPSAAELEYQAHLFGEWLEQNLALYRAQKPFDRQFWSVINNYFYCCWNLGKPRTITDLYDRIGEDAWVNPFIFHHTACAYTALGDKAHAIEEICKALAFGYDKSSEMLSDPDLAGLAGEGEFIRLKAWFEQVGDRPRLYPQPMLERLATVADPIARMQLVNDFDHYQFPGRDEITAIAQTDAGRAREYEGVVTHFLNDIAIDHWRNERDGGKLFLRPYLRFKTLPGLHPIVHLLAAISWFHEGFFYLDMSPDRPSDRNEFKIAMQAVVCAKSRLALQDDADWRELFDDPLLASLLSLAD